MKESLSESATNAYFDTTQPVELVVDASPVGLAALLVQRGRVVTYASRALSNVETRYSQTEREALAVVWACEHFDRFLNGAPQFTVFTDHKPLETIWQKPRPPLRIERWGLRLQPYKMVVKYRPGTDNPADYLSRHPAGQNILRSHEQQMAEHYVNTIASAAVPLAMTVEEIQRETTKDPTLQAVIELVRSKKWHNIAQYQGTDVNCATLRQFSRVQDELTVNESGNMVLRNYQIVIPQSLQQRAIDIAHEGHQGICKTKALLRSKVWFPGSDAAAEEAVRRCIPCQANTTRRQAEPLAMTPLPRGPWLNVSIDFCGPLPSGEYLLVIVDEFSRYPVVEITRSTAADTVIPVVDKVFSLFGFPEVIKSDNGPPFQGHAWKVFLKECGVRHRRITPLWPQANGQVENFNKSLEKALKAARVKGEPWRPELLRVLRSYRCTPHVTTGFTPHRLMFGRDPRTKLPQLTEHVHPDDREVRARDKAGMKAYADGKSKASSSKIGTGNVVLVRQRKSGKLSTPYDPRPLIVTERKGSMVTARRQDGSTVTRNASMFNTLPYESAEDHPVVVREHDGPEMTPQEEDGSVVADPTPPSPGQTLTGRLPPAVLTEPRRSTRQRRPAQRLLEEI